MLLLQLRVFSFEYPETESRSSNRLDLQLSELNAVHPVMFIDVSAQLLQFNVVSAASFKQEREVREEL